MSSGDIVSGPTISSAGTCARLRRTRVIDTGSVGSSVPAGWTSGSTDRSLPGSGTRSGMTIPSDRWSGTYTDCVSNHERPRPSSGIHLLSGPHVTHRLEFPSMDLSVIKLLMFDFSRALVVAAPRRLPAEQ